jgi:hypothetical protein
MASTNEDAVVLATARCDDGRLLVVRHLPDRGTVEIAWWLLDNAGTLEQQQTLELAAEAVELDAFARLCDGLVKAEENATGDGNGPAAASPLPDGAELKAISSGDGWLLVRQPDLDNRLELSPAGLRLLVAKLPEARQALETQGFGLPQQMA